MSDPTVPFVPISTGSFVAIFSGINEEVAGSEVEEGDIVGILFYGFSDELLMSLKSLPYDLYPGE